MDEFVQVAITIGGNMSLGVTDKQSLVLSYTNRPAEGEEIIANLGRCTKRRIEDLIEYLNRLKVHAQ